MVPEASKELYARLQRETERIRGPSSTGRSSGPSSDSVRRGTSPRQAASLQRTSTSAAAAVIASRKARPTAGIVGARPSQYISHVSDPVTVNRASPRIRDKPHSGSARNARASVETETTAGSGSGSPRTIFEELGDLFHSKSHVEGSITGPISPPPLFSPPPPPRSVAPLPDDSRGLGTSRLGLSTSATVASTTLPCPTSPLPLVAVTGFTLTVENGIPHAATVPENPRTGTLPLFDSKQQQQQPIAPLVASTLALLTPPSPAATTSSPGGGLFDAPPAPAALLSEPHPPRSPTRIDTDTAASILSPTVRLSTDSTAAAPLEDPLSASSNRSHATKDFDVSVANNSINAYVTNKDTAAATRTVGGGQLGPHRSPPSSASQRQECAGAGGSTLNSPSPHSVRPPFTPATRHHFGYLQSQASPAASNVEQEHGGTSSATVPNSRHVAQLSPRDRSPLSGPAGATSTPDSGLRSNDRIDCAHGNSADWVWSSPLCTSKLLNQPAPSSPPAAAAALAFPPGGSVSDPSAGPTDVGTAALLSDSPAGGDKGQSCKDSLRAATYNQRLSYTPFQPIYSTPEKGGSSRTTPATTPRGSPDRRPAAQRYHIPTPEQMAKKIEAIAYLRSSITELAGAVACRDSLLVEAVQGEIARGSPSQQPPSRYREASRSPPAAATEAPSLRSKLSISESLSNNRQSIAAAALQHINGGLDQLQSMLESISPPRAESNAASNAGDTPNLTKSAMQDSPEVAPSQYTLLSPADTQARMSGASPLSIGDEAESVKNRTAQDTPPPVLGDPCDVLGDQTVLMSTIPPASPGAMSLIEECTLFSPEPKEVVSRDGVRAKYSASRNMYHFPQQHVLTGVGQRLCNSSRGAAAGAVNLGPADEYEHIDHFIAESNLRKMNSSMWNVYHLRRSYDHAVAPPPVDAAAIRKLASSRLRPDISATPRYAMHTESSHRARKVLPPRQLVPRPPRALGQPLHYIPHLSLTSG